MDHQHDSTIRADVVLAEMRAGFAALHSTVAELKSDHLRMHADNKSDQLRMHEETSDRLDLINGKVNRAHERISVVERSLEAAEKAVEYCRKRIHEVANGVRPELKFIAAVVAGTIAFVIAALRLMGKLDW